MGPKADGPLKRWLCLSDADQRSRSRSLSDDMYDMR